MLLSMGLIALALLIALYLVNEQRRRQKLKVDRAVMMLCTLLMDKNNGKWRRQWEWIVENHTPVKGDPYSQSGCKELRAQVSVLIKAFKLLDDKGV